MNLRGASLTNGLVIANVVIFLLILVTGTDQQAIIRAGFFPIRFGGAVPQLPVEITLVPAWLTPISAAFLHGGFMHLTFNMLLLLFCGRSVEQVLGWRLMAVLYIVGAYAAALAEFAVNSQSAVPVIGASGAISAIFGAYALLFSRDQVKSFGPIPGHAIRIIWLSITWIAIQLMIRYATSGSINGIAIFAHIGGFVAGLLLTRPLIGYRFRNA